jgi:transposase
LRLASLVIPTFRFYLAIVVADSEAASKALPCVIQVADRWHFMENASSAFLSAVRKSMRPIRPAIGATTINPELLSCAERLQYEGYLRREETIATILALGMDGAAIKQIVRKTGHSRNRVRQVLRGDTGDVFRTRQSSLDAHLPLLDAQWAGGCRNGAKLWQRLKSNGFRGSQRVGDPAPSRRKGQRSATAEGPLGSNDRTADDVGA